MRQRAVIEKVYAQVSHCVK